MSDMVVDATEARGACSLKINVQDDGYASCTINTDGTNISVCAENTEMTLDTSEESEQIEYSLFDEHSDLNAEMLLMGGPGAAAHVRVSTLL
jgi:hypothetical protein